MYINNLKKLLWKFLLIFFKKNTFFERSTTYRPKLFKQNQVADICIKEKSPWDSDLWINNQKLKIQSKSIKEIKNPQFAFFELCLNLLREDNNNLEIMDFGGGGGIYFEKTKEYISHDKNLFINYTIIDSQKNISICEEYLNDSNNCKLNLISLDKLGNIKKYLPDLILISAVLQYLDNWQEDLFNIIKCNPKYICILRTPIAKNAPFEARVVQNVKTNMGYCGPVMITLFPLDAIEKFMKKNNYKLLTSFPEQISNKNYFRNGCENKEFRSVVPWNYVFIRS